MAAPGRTARATLRSGVGDVEATVWSSPGVAVGGEAPLLVVHDGPEYRRRTRLPARLAALVAAERLPPHRAAFLAPLEREETYSASARYARALVDDVLPGLAAVAPGRARAGLGCSLGALALLHAHRTRPESFDGLFLQSGSYFRRRTDGQESGFRRFARVTRFVGTVLCGRDGARPIPLTITVGLDEENLANNRLVAAALRRQDYDVRVHEAPGGHTWKAWREALEPQLPDLLARAWRWRT